MKIAILHQHVPDDALPDEKDVLSEVEAVRTSLHRLGHETRVVAVTLDFGALERELKGIDLAFNLVETFAGTGRLHHFIPSFLEHRGITYAGNTGEGLFLTSHKVLTKEWARRFGIPVPPSHLETDGPCFVKPIAEDASLGIDDQSLVPDRVAAQKILDAKGPGWFAEAYIEGREINVGLLDGEVIPPAEVHFEGDWGSRPKIVNYACKWIPGSFEWDHAFRRIDVDAKTAKLVGDIARECWKAFDLRGWARVDFRVTPDGEPYVLEVNGNPCLALDAGFAASIEAIPMSYDRCIEIIVQAGLR